MKQSFINKITLCKHCHSAFIIDEEGTDDTCDTCLVESELSQELIDSEDGLLEHIQEQLNKDN